MDYFHASLAPTNGRFRHLHVHILPLHDAVMPNLMTSSCCCSVLSYVTFAPIYGHTKQASSDHKS
jgi:hypothetical protein